MVELVYKFDETSTANVEKVSRPLRCHSNVFSFFGGGGRTDTAITNSVQPNKVIIKLLNILINPHCFFKFGQSDSQQIVNKYILRECSLEHEGKK